MEALGVVILFLFFTAWGVLSLQYANDNTSVRANDKGVSGKELAEISNEA